MWGRVILGAVIVTLTILWLVAIVLLFLDERTLLQKWQRGLWNSANWPVPTRVLNTEKVGKCPSRICAQKTHSLVSVRISNAIVQGFVFCKNSPDGDANESRLARNFDRFDYSVSGPNFLYAVTSKLQCRRRTDAHA
jgi:hypothetical protein